MWIYANSIKETIIGFGGIGKGFLKLFRRESIFYMKSYSIPTKIYEGFGRCFATGIFSFCIRHLHERNIISLSFCTDVANIKKGHN